MILTVSTICAPPEDVEVFVRRNLDAGADHAVVVVESECEIDVLSGHLGDTATLVAARDWWADGDRPPGLNRRQVLLASTVMSICAAGGFFDWVAHIDGDETLAVDRDRLEALAPGVDAVRLHTLEAVCHPAATEHEFKRQLSGSELRLLGTLGLLAAPSNADYFRGHLRKAIVRPSFDFSLGIHRLGHRDREPVEIDDHGFGLLHHESPTVETFRAKWTALVRSGPLSGASMKPHRSGLAEAVATLLDTPISDRTRDELLAVLFERFAVDHHYPVTARLGWIESRAAVHHVPRPLPPERLETFRRALHRAASGPKDVFRTGRPAERRAGAAAVLGPAPR